MSAPLASVLMTAYNREKYIAEAVDSVLVSTFNDFELIIVDDASTDRTVEIARSYSTDPRVQVHVNEKNVGDYNNRNRAASLARGKYLKYLDSDDVIYPHGLEVMVHAMEQFPSAALGLERPPMKEDPFPLQVGPRAAYCEHFLMGGLLDCGPTAAIMRASAFRESGGFSGKRLVGDTELWLKLAASYPIVKLPQSLIWWRRHEEQEFAANNAEIEYMHLRYQLGLETLMMEHCPLSSEERDAAIRLLKYRHGRNILRLAVRDRHARAALRMLRQTNFSLINLLRVVVPHNNNHNHTS
jgi:glycosyltransferase involved in cell wall biosynthesis